MVAIISGRKYNTETATAVGEWGNGLERTNSDYCIEILYKKKTGEYFLYGRGGATSKYREADLRWKNWTWGEKIEPFSEEEAKKWAEEHLSAKKYEEIFGEVEE